MKAKINLSYREKQQIVNDYWKAINPLIDKLTEIHSLKTPRILINLSTGEVNDVDYGPKTDLELSIERTIDELKSFYEKKLEG